MRLHYFADELMAGGAAKAVVAALEFKIGVADAGGKQADESEALAAARFGTAAEFDAAVFEVNGEHATDCGMPYPGVSGDGGGEGDQR